LESAITNLQFDTQMAVRVQALLDEHRQALGDISTHDDEDRVWRLALHRMDVREYAVADDPSMPQELRDKGYIRLEPKDPEPDLKEIVDRNAPRFARMQDQMGLLMWAFRIFKREIECSDPDEWRGRLKSAMTFEGETATEPMRDMVSGAPAIVAAVCVRDYWGKLSDEEKTWCVESVCSAVLANSNNWNRYATVQRFEMSPDRSCAWIMAALVTKDLPKGMKGRVEDTFVAALTHPVE